MIMVDVVVDVFLEGLVMFFCFLDLKLFPDCIDVFVDSFGCLIE